MRQASRAVVRTLTLGSGAGLMAASAAGTAAAHGEVAPPLTLAAMTSWSLDPLPWAVSLTLAVGYLLAVRRVNRVHPRSPFPRRRVIAWLAGVGLVLVALVSAIDIYADSLLTVHMVQHLLLAMVAPPLLALGAPVTLALRVASPSVRHRLFLPALHSRIVRVATSPFVAWPLFALVMWFTHFTTLYNAALEDPALHVVEHLVFLASGALFWWPVVGADPSPSRMGHGARIAYLVLQMPVNAVVGLAIYFAPTVLYPHYASLQRAWGPDALTDQQIGGLVMWGAGDLLLLAAVTAVVAAWMQHDARRARRADARYSA